MTDKPPPITRKCPECGREAVHTPYRSRRWYYHRKCDECWREHKALLNRASYHRRKGTTPRRTLIPPSDHAIEQASTLTPCANCLFLGTCETLVKERGINPLCFETSIYHDLFCEQYDKMPKSKEWKKEAVWSL